MQTKRVPVVVARHHYDIDIAQGLLREGSYFDFVRKRDVLIITDDTVSALYADLIQQTLLDAGAARVEQFVFASGEVQKQLSTIEQIYTYALERHFDRQCCFVALGGGVVGDMAGFAAATFLRGVPFIQLPTTLLSQVDSSVGGKTGVNHPLGKNLIGAFYQPQSVVIDTDTLKTLPQREVSAGLAEVVKYGLIHDIDFLSWLYGNVEALVALEDTEIATAIKRSVEIKAEIVSKDEREQGVRAYLNFGHTFGHAIENLLGYGEWLHGEAVGLGMLMAMRLSEQLGQISTDDVRAYERFMQVVKLPLTLPDHVNTFQMLKAMSGDKKVAYGRLRLVTLQNLGRAEIRDDIVEQQIIEAIERCR